MSKIDQLTRKLEDDVNKAETWVEGDEDASYTAKDGEKVPSIRNLNKRAEINIEKSKENANRAEEYARKAESASTAANISSGLFPSVVDGLSQTFSGDFFSVIDKNDFNFIVLYENRSGEAIEVKKYPSSEAISTIRRELVIKSNGLASALKFAPASFFGDMNFTHVDADGFVLNDPGLLEALNNNSLQLIFSPYSDFDDFEQYNIVDQIGNVLGNTFSEESATEWGENMHVFFSKDTCRLEVSWIHDERIMLKATWCPNGFNEVFNFKEIHKAEVGNPVKANWELIQRVTTDYIPPIWVYAQNEPTSPSGTGLVGGNHGTNGGSGERTAYMRFCDFYIDGNKLADNFVGFVKSITAHWVNDLYAGNTVNEKRFCVEQRLVAIFSKRNVYVTCETHFLEPVRMYSDGGTQMVGTGWEDGAQFYKGKNREMIKVVASDDFNAGDKADFPDVWASVLKSDELGFMASWIDRDYGVKNNFVADNEQLSFKGKNLYKFYNFAIRSPVVPFEFKDGESYAWKGGYSYYPHSLIDGIESGFVFENSSKKCIALASTEGKKGFLNLPPELIGRDFLGIDTFADRVKVDADNYIAGYFEEK